jgi:hypothetical protein
VREDVPGDRRLVAYAVARDQQKPDSAALRTALRQRLPEYMVPSAVVWLDELPLTRNGKVDRRALPAPRQETDQSYEAARTDHEELVCKIWSEVLGVEQVSIHDNFFELGGHSLLVIQVHRRLREQVLPDLPITELFNHTTVAALAGHIQRSLAERATTRPGAAPAAVAATSARDVQIHQNAGRARLTRRRALRQEDEGNEY